MATFAFSGLTIPTPQPYDSHDDNRQRENLCYVLLQVFLLAKSTGMSIDDQGLINLHVDLFNITEKLEDLVGVGGGSSGDWLSLFERLEQLIQAVQDLRFNNITLDFGKFKIMLTGQNLEYA